MAKTTTTVQVPLAQLTKVDAENAVDFLNTTTLRVTLSTYLSAEQRTRLAQIVGYAWASVIRARGASLSEGTVLLDAAGVTFYNAYFSETPRRTDRAEIWAEFVEAVRTYVRQGTPVRSTNREGVGSKGTRLVGPVVDHDAVTLSFWVDATVSTPRRVTLDLSRFSGNVDALLEVLLAGGAEITPAR